MRFLVDAHLPRRLCAVLARHGYDAVHTFDLPAKNATKDWAINQISLVERIQGELYGQRGSFLRSQTDFAAAVLLGCAPEYGIQPDTVVSSRSSSRERDDIYAGLFLSARALPWQAVFRVSSFFSNDTVRHPLIFQNWLSCIA
ncbi:MAG: hypothetical protein DMG08_10285 [Acidobacteria bacterium]|nr:MAG: hypothetical protein DMG08_10285 [Acidobacteriota bacterium]